MNMYRIKIPYVQIHLITARSSPWMRLTKRPDTVGEL
jgi:hypothetical protein